MKMIFIFLGRLERIGSYRTSTPFLVLGIKHSKNIEKLFDSLPQTKQLVCLAANRSVGTH